MNHTTLFGASLLGLGLGLLLATLFSWLALFWPLIALLVAAMLWRQAGTIPLRVALGIVALVWALSSVNFDNERFRVPEVGGVNITENSRVLETLSATNEQLSNWQTAEKFRLVNAVGTVSVEGGELAVEVTYRSNRRRARAPERLHATYDEGTLTLTLIGIDPDASERERRGLSADILLKIPTSATLEVMTEVADVEVENVGATILTTTVGNLRAEAIRENLKAVSEAGDIRVHNSQGAVNVRSNVGTLNLSFENSVEAPVKARTRVGDIKLSLPESSNITLRAFSALQSFSGNLERITPNEGRLLLGDERIEISLQTDVGEIDVQTY